VKDLFICGVEIPPMTRIFWILEILPPGNQWKNLRSTLEITGKTEHLPELIDYLVSFESNLQYESANLITKKEKGRHNAKKAAQPNSKTDAITNGTNSNAKKTDKCAFCKNKGHVVADCKKLAKKNEITPIRRRRCRLTKLGAINSNVSRSFN
jgi:hypothetical protein